VHLLSKRFVLGGAPFHPQPSNLEMLHADVGMTEQVCFMSGSVQQFVGYRTGLDETTDSAGRTTAHGPSIADISAHATAKLGDLYGVAGSTVYRAGTLSKSAAAGRSATMVTASPDAKKIVADDGRNSTSVTYRPRHGAPSDLPSENRGRPRARTVRADKAPQTGR
jgi:hypothetical protein